jgi:hypothetical protein
MVHNATYAMQSKLLSSAVAPLCTNTQSNWYVLATSMAQLACVCNQYGSTHPLHLAQACLAGLVEVAGSAVLVRHDGCGLQAVGEDDVGVHRCNVEVIDQRHLLPAGSR